MQTGSPPVLTCPVCFETFRRAEHLKRHSSTHVDDKPHACQFCDSRYKRSDALRRHWKACTGRLASGYQIPKRSLSGKRKQACDRCTSRKRACSIGQPCSECLLRGTECTYSRAQGLREDSAASSSWVGLETSLPGGSIDSETFNQSRRCQKPKTSLKHDDFNPDTYVSRSQQTRFDFLLNFTKATGLNEAYNYSSKRGPSFPDDGYVDDARATESFSFDDTDISNPFDCYLDEVEASIWGDFTISTPVDSNPTQGFSQALVEKTSHLWETLHPVLESTAFKHYKPSSLEVFGFFSPDNLTRYLDLFWSRWYRHCPIIHKATFDLSNCSTLLFATMSLVGACMSSRNSDHQGAKQVLDVIEEIIFSNPLFSETSSPAIGKYNSLESLHDIQTLQATCFMCLLQKWEGNHAAKLRIQRHRFTAFVATTRAMGLSQAIHPRGSIDSRFGINEWKGYILKEEMIRTFNHVFLLDSAFVIFHNSVPRMVLQEMTINLTCPEDMFQASTPEEFLAALKSHPPRLTPPLLTDCVRNLCAESPNPDIIASLHSESALNLFTIATAIHGLIFHQLRAFSPLPLATDPLKKALDRWEEAWRSSAEKFPKLDSLGEGNQEDAFPHRAREFALLARVHIEKSHLSTEEWNAMVKNLPESVPQGSSEGLATFDQTDMDQVAGLILAVENLDLE